MTDSSKIYCLKTKTTLVCSLTLYDQSDFYKNQIRKNGSNFHL